MRLVGASTMFIQLPFMLEGAIAATIGALLAVGGLWLGVEYLITDWLGASVGWIPYVSTADVLTVAPILIVGRDPARRDLLPGHPQPLHEGVTHAPLCGCPRSSSSLAAAGHGVLRRAGERPTASTTAARPPRRTRRRSPRRATTPRPRWRASTPASRRSRCSWRTRRRRSPPRRPRSTRRTRRWRRRSARRRSSRPGWQDAKDQQATISTTITQDADARDPDARRDRPDGPRGLPGRRRRLGRRRHPRLAEHRRLRASATAS